MARRPHRWAFWLLPLLVARLFVPVGFMVSASAAGIGIALCPGYAPLPEGAGPAHSAHHHDGMDHAGQGSAPSECPFVLVGSVAGCPPTELAGELLRLAELRPGFQPHPDWISPAVLIDRIRGPPLA
jgi:hypothetical protein